MQTVDDLGAERDAVAGQEDFRFTAREVQVTETGEKRTVRPCLSFPPGPSQSGHDRAPCALGAGSSIGCRQVTAFIDLCAGASVPFIR